jgi:excinuclease ABC subunit A
VIQIDQSPIGRTPRSNPATYTGLFTFIRELFAMLPEAKARGFRPGTLLVQRQGRALRDLPGGRRHRDRDALPAQRLRDVRAVQGTRYNRETLEIKYRGKSVADVLDLTVDQALPLLENFPPIANKLRTLQDVGLGYLGLGPVGDDAQRRRGAARQAAEGAVAPRHRAHALHPRRADDRASISPTRTSCSTC